MTSSQTVGIDLPLKILVWENEKGITQLGYYNPEELAVKHEIKDKNEVIEKMKNALNGITNAAIK